MLTIKNLTKSFDQTVLEDLNIQFIPGETTVILGPSGSGKSTLLRTIDLLETPDKGTIEISGEELTFPRKMSFPELKAHRQHFSMVFQQFNLFPHLSVLQNVMEGPVQVKKVNKETARREAILLLEKVGLADKQNEYPQQLSGGQMQRVAIARALAMEPEFILYDEPTSALDPELAQEVLQVIQKIAQDKKGQIIVTHHIEFARKVADRIIFLENGQIYFEGHAAEFFDSSAERIQKYVQQFV